MVVHLDLRAQLLAREQSAWKHLLGIHAENQQRRSTKRVYSEPVPTAGGVDFFLPKEKGTFVDEDMASEFLSWWSENNGGSCLLQKRMLCNRLSCFVHTNSTDKGSRYSQWQLLLKKRTGDRPVPTKDHGHESARGEWRSGNRGNSEGTCGVTDVAALDWWPRERILP